MLATAFTCLALIGAALYLQHKMFLLPCPLCVIQRYLYLAVAIACLVGAASRSPRLWSGLGLVSALGGMGAAAKQLYVLAHPGLSCGIDPMETMLNKVPTAIYLPWLFQADGLCEDATEGLFGLSIPQWSFGWFAILAVVMLVLTLRRRA
jgi:disulfide bond formation protein DsbB